MLIIVTAIQYLCDLILFEHKYSTLHRQQQAKVLLLHKIQADYKTQHSIRKIPFGFAIGEYKYTFDAMSKNIYYQSPQNPRPTHLEIISRQVNKLEVLEDHQALEICIYFHHPKVLPLRVQHVFKQK